MPVLKHYLKEELNTLDAAMRRALLTARNLPDGMVEMDSARYINFSGNDYLGLSQHPSVKKAAIDALDHAGVAASASRLLTGNHLYYELLETQLARQLGFDAALVFASGYAANMGVISALMGPGDLILADKLAHACMIDGAKLSGAKLMRFAHNDTAHAKALLKKHRGQYQKALIISEHVFSMDGDIAPIDALINLKNTYDCWLMIDDAHGVGVIECKQKKSVDIWSGTLSKSLASLGGYVLGSAELIDYITQKARSFLFSTALPPSVVAGAYAALLAMEQQPERGIKVMAHARHFTQALGLEQAQSPIVPLVLGAAEDAVSASKKLQQSGFWVMPIRPPTVALGTARLRFSFSASHSDQQVDALIAAVKKWDLKNVV
jgi:8-amino-7-oxononanoate synthase